jgi:hypothetical protein
VKYWEIIADNLSEAGWSWGCVLGVDCNGEKSSLPMRHRGENPRFVVGADEKLTGFCRKVALAVLPRPGSASFRRTQFLPELILSGRRVPENFHRGGGGRNRSEPIARLRDGGACGHYVAYLLHGPLGRLLFCRQDHVFARISKCRCAKCERRNQCTAGDGNICFLHYDASVLMLMVMPVRQVS